MDTPRGKLTRRRFIKETAAGTVAVAGTPAMLAGLARTAQTGTARLP